MKFINDEISRLHLKYPDIPLEAIIKQDILRLGLSFAKPPQENQKRYKTKDYFIFSFDMATLDELEAKGKQFMSAPEEVKFYGGELDLKPTIFNVRLNPKSPYQINFEQEKPILCYQNQPFADTEFHPYPDFYQSKLTSGKKISQIAPVLEWGYLIYLTIFRLCQYWGRDEECQYCDINENYRQQKKAGKEYTGVKNIKDILEALSIIKEKDSVTRAITITGGSITSNLHGKKESDFYLDYITAISKKFGKHWIIKAVVEAYELEDCKKLKQGGIQIYHPNYEIWDQQLFKQICPGKERFVGWQEWMNRIVASADIFGPANVIPNFVAGVEMAQPMGISNVHEAVESTRQGLEFFMSKSIMPRFTTWCREPLAHLKDQMAPPLEYYAKLLLVWRDTMEKYQLPAPPGYGEPGVGKAVFSVSAFMDVIRQ